MMKKLTALLLCVAMLMVGVVAQAESGYEYIKAYLSDDLSLDELSLYGGVSTKIDFASNTDNSTVLVFEVTSSKVVLIGDNANGEFEGTTWQVDVSDFLKVLQLFCDSFSDFQEKMDDGYTFVIMLANGDDAAMIDSPEEAAELSAILSGN